MAGYFKYINISTLTAIETILRAVIIFCIPLLYEVRTFLKTKLGGSWCFIPLMVTKTQNSTTIDALKLKIRAL